jgi:hypothetical protein
MPKNIWLVGMVIENCHWKNFAKPLNFLPILHVILFSVWHGVSILRHELGKGFDSMMSGFIGP